MWAWDIWDTLFCRAGWDSRDTVFCQLGTVGIQFLVFCCLFFGKPGTVGIQNSASLGQWGLHFVSLRHLEYRIM